MNTDIVMIDIINRLLAPYGMSMSHMVADIMNRKFKQWWSSIPPISTQRTINWTHWIPTWPRYMTLEIQVLVWNRHRHVAGLNLLMASQSSLLDKWISPQCIYKQTIKQSTKIHIHSKTPHTITKMNDNINLESTKAGSMSALS